MSLSVWLFLLFVYLSTHVLAQSQAVENRKLHASGEEVITVGQVSATDAILGQKAIPNSKHTITKIKDGKVISETFANIGENGFRISSASHLPGKTKHILLIGSSTIFGEGLKDDETLSHNVNQRSKVFEAYPMAFYGSGPQHIWLQFKAGNLPKKIKEKRGRALIITHIREFDRFFGTVSTLPYTASFPYVKETSLGHFEFAGLFQDSGDWWQKIIIQICLPVRSCAAFLPRLESNRSDEELAIIGRLLKEIEKMYREQLDVENVQIVWKGSKILAEKISKYSQMKVITTEGMSEETNADGHSTANGVKNFTDFLFDKKLVY